MISIETSASAQRPSGASSFFVDRGPFYPGSQIDIAAFDLERDKILDWPVVYILANDREAYVGQTTSAATRINQHGANVEKQDFESVNIIYHDEFNASVVTDYEHRLIGLMHADGRYRLTNKNDGMTETSYFSKGEYAAMFEDLWEELRKLELADHSIADIEETEVFKYSPYKGLTVDQRVALDAILAAIRDGIEDSKPIVVEGMPGTGKTVLAIYLLKMLKDDPAYKGLNVRIVEPVTSLRETLRKSLRNVGGLDPGDVIAPTDLVKPEMGYSPDGGKCFDIVLVDEAHKLKRRKNLGTQFGNYDRVTRELGLADDATQMDWVIAQAKLPVFFYDPLQSIGPSCLGMSAMRSALGGALDDPIELYSQMRVKGGRAYLDYVRAILDAGEPEFETFGEYDFVLHKNFADFVDSFERDCGKHELSRMVAGYAWKWESNPKKCKDPAVRDIVIDGIGLKWNCTYDNWVVKGAEDPRIAHEVGCIHSTQGYDLSYAYVIIGNDLAYDPETGTLVADKANYYDRNGYATASREELDQYIKNIYYVLLTRGVLGTHVYAVNPEMRQYLSKFLPQSV
ncbi:DUF2075 domain-containing protein [Xiamenia xianingshaonis]|uniref:DUF2075 domain-containing protein n=1 Tax=Xiamenia xianingshaonis TaxID=2682776 RepID=A0ABX0IMK8_9ACTN|nr:DUF2075 domain-containing protein [Xiamenia xianingshaonis]NHM15036.1 DUF2075 domain-containing protein [Xiamenia xianingshaonis]